MMRGIFTLVFCLGVSYVIGQTVPPVAGVNVGDYYSGQSGLWTAPSTWFVWDGDSWEPATAAPIDPTLAEVITVAAGHTVRITASLTSDNVFVSGSVTTQGAGTTWSIRTASAGTQLTINSTGIVTVSAGTTLQRSSLAGTGGQVAVFGSLRNSGVIANMASNRLFFNAASSYRHQVNGGAIPPATWNATSTCIVTGATTLAPGGLNQTFGNFQWNSPSQSGDIDLAGSLSNVVGNLLITNTSGSLLVATNNNPLNLIVGGNIAIGAAALFTFTIDADVTVRSVNFSNASNNFISTIGAGSVELDINGNFANSRIFNAGESIGRTTMRLAGNFTNSGTASIISTGSASMDVIFDGGVVQTFTSIYEPTFPINYATSGITNLTVAPTSSLSGPGSLTINTGSFLTVRNVQTTGALRNSTTLGNVRVSGTRTYNGTIIYGGAARQYMFADTPDVATIIRNAAHVDLAESVTFTSGTLTLQTGQLRIANNATLAVSNLVYGTGVFGYDAGSSLVFNGTGNVELRLGLIAGTPAGTGMNNLTINRAGTVTQIPTTLRVDGTLALSNGTLAIGTRTLQAYGEITTAVGGALSAAGGRVYVRGAGDLPAAVPLSGTLAVLEVDRVGERLTTTGALSITTLNLFGGEVAATGGAQMANGGTIWRTDGDLVAAIGAAGVYNVQYSTFSTPSITTNFEIPASGTALNTVTINNTANPNGIVALNKPIVAAGQVRVLRGELQTNDLNVTTGGNFRVDATGRLNPGESTFSFTGGINQSYVTIDSDYTPYTLEGIVVNKTAGTMTLGSAVNIRNNFTVSSLTTVAAGTDRLTLLSDAQSTAYVPTLPADGTNRARITGTVIVQRYLPNSNSTRQYRYLSAPTTNTTVFDWQQEIPISGTFTNPSVGVFDGVAIKSTNPSMFYYNNVTGLYVAYPSSGSSTVAGITSGRGYSVFGRTRTVTPLVLDSHGTLGQHDVNVTVTYTAARGVNAGFNLVGNPYPSPISWSSLLGTSVGLQPTIQLTDNNNNGPSASNGRLITYNSVTQVAVPAGSFDGTIAMGQGFWVETVSGPGTKQVRFRESNKVPGQAKFIRQREPDNLLRLAMSSDSVTDHLAILLLDSATDAYDKFDSRKFASPGLQVAALSIDNQPLVISSIAKGGCDRSVRIEIGEAKVGVYTFDFTGLESFDSDITPVLVDKVENKTIDLTVTPTYQFNISDVSTVSGRFEVRFGGVSLNTQLLVKGEATCVGNSSALITLPSSQAGVQYTATVNGTMRSAAVTGNGGQLEIPVNLEGLPVGSNEVTIAAQSATCGTQNLAQKAIVNILQKPVINNVTAGQVCGSGSANLQATAAGGISYNWYEAADDVTPIANQHGSTFATPELSKTKTYFVAAVNEAGCEGERVEVKAIVNYVTPAAVTSDGTLLISNYESGNQWYLDGEVIPGATGKSIEASSSGVYTVQVSTGSCTIISEGRAVTILGAESNDSFIRVYPNPSPDKVFLEVRYQGDVAAELVSTTGIQLDKANLSGSDDLKTASFDIHSLPEGMYLVRVKAGNKTFTKKILKAK